MKRCYNCAVPIKSLDKKERTKEHIPARAFFVGYPEMYKLQRKTVPACLKCNEDYAKIDDDLRDVIGILNENENFKSEITKKTIKKIFHNKKDLNKKVKSKNGELYFTFNANNLDNIHIKNFKGLYYHIMNCPLSNTFDLTVFSDGKKEKELKIGIRFLKELIAFENWETSGHSAVFSYCMVHYDFYIEKLVKLSKEIKDPILLVGALKYNETIVALVMATKPELKSKVEKM